MLTHHVARIWKSAAAAILGLVGLLGITAAPAPVDACPPLWMTNPNAANPPPISWMLAMKEWDPDGAGPATPILVCGNGANLPPAGCGKIAGWTGSGWIPMSVPLDFNTVRDFYVDTDNSLYVAVSAFSGNSIMYRWNGSTWLPVGTGATANGFSITKFNGQFVVGGNIGVSGGGNIVRLAGNQWQAMGPGLFTTGTAAICRAVSVYNGVLYAGGDFQVVGPLPNPTPCAYLARWTGTTWQQVPGWTFGEVLSMLVFGGNLYLGTGNGVYVYNGSTFQSLGAGQPAQWVYALTTFNGNLVAGGDFGAPFSQRLARWTGSSWQPFGSGLGNGGVYSLATWTSPDGPELVAGGSFTSIGGSSQSPYWGRWISPTDPAVPSGPPVRIRTCGPNTVFLSVSATGGYLSYQWRRSGTPIANGPSGTGSFYSGVNTPALVITNTSAADSDLYDCVVSNPCGSATSGGSSLVVTDPPIVFQQPQSFLVCQNSSTTFTFNTFSVQPQTHQWFKQNLFPPVAITVLSDGPSGNGSFYSGANTPNLTLSNIQPADQDYVYFCVATAACGYVESAQAGLSVRTLPEIISIPPLPTQVCGHGNFTLSVVATQNFPGPLSYAWWKDGIPLFDVASCGSTITGSQTSTMSVTNAAGVDSGLYYCLVTNACGGTFSYTIPVTVCPADVDDGSNTGTCDGGVGSEDLLYYLDLYSNGDPLGDVDDSSMTGTPDCGLGIDDLLYYLTIYNNGC